MNQNDQAELNERFEDFLDANPVAATDWQDFQQKHDQLKSMKAQQPRFGLVQPGGVPPMLDPTRAMLQEELKELRQEICRRMHREGFTDDEMTRLIPAIT